MTISIIKETIEISDFTTDADGNAFFQKRINLSAGKIHRLLQTDMFEDAYINLGTFAKEKYEVVVSPYPAIPTDMPFSGILVNRYPSAGDDSVLFKSIARVIDEQDSEITQFPSLQIAANQKTEFYTDHLYINLHWMGLANIQYSNLALSFMFVVDSKTVATLTHSLGVLAESHNAMCALVMSNGHMVTRAVLRGNVFPMWRFGGIRPEHMITPTAANAYFLPINTRDAETMTTTPGIRQAVADSRQMSAFDAPFGDRRPDWMRMHLNAGIVSGAVRDQWPPIKHADNGNVRML